MFRRFSGPVFLIAAVALLTASSLGSALHYVLFPHTFCAHKAEIVHTHSCEHAEQTTLEKKSHGHEICSLNFFGPRRFLLPQGQLTLLHRLELTKVRIEAHEMQVPTLEPYSYAPKTSPPSHA